MPQADDPFAIVVTGERAARSIRETASSVVVETAVTLDDRANPDRVEQILQSTPNVQLGSGGEGPTIRGQDSTGAVRDLPAFLSGTRPRATIQVDGRAATYYELALGLTSLWDVSRVEVFRSPQTTTQGRNSIGGAIFVETNEPDFSWGGKLRAIAGNFDTRQVSGAVGGPLAGDQLAFRVSGDLRRSRTSSRLTSRAIGIDPNRDDSELVRLKFLAQPSTLPGVRLSLAYSHGRSQMPQIEGLRAPFDQRRDPDATYGIFAITADSLTARAVYEPAGDIEARATVSFGRADVGRHAPPGFGEARIDARDFSVEPVLVWRAPSGLSLTGGLHYTRATLDQTIDLTTQVQVQGRGVFFDEQDSLGLFSEAVLPLGADVSVTAGLRCQHDRQTRQGGLSGRVIDLPLDYRRSFDACLPKLSLAWDATPTVRIGGFVQRASNPGGININTGLVRLELFDAESLWDFELFARARSKDDQFALSGNIFHYAITDAQRTQLITVIQPDGRIATSAQVANAPRAWSTGLELQMDWHLTPRLQVRGALGLLNTRITETLDPLDPILGKQFQRSPRVSGSGSIVWRPTQSFTLACHARHNSSYFSDDLETPQRQIAGSTTADAKASWQHRGATVFGYVRNLFDRFQLTYLFPPSSNLATAGDPREIGVGVEATF